MDAGVFTKKIGPLPVWGWMGIGTAGLLALGSAGKGKNKQQQNSPSPQIQPPNNTQDPANALGQFAGGAFGSIGQNRPASAHTRVGRPPKANQWNNSDNGQYGHTGYPSHGNGWTGKQGHLSERPPHHEMRAHGRDMKHGAPGGHEGGHSGGWGGSKAGSGHHGIGGGSRGVGGQYGPHGGQHGGDGAGGGGGHQGGRQAPPSQGAPQHQKQQGGHR